MQGCLKINIHPTLSDVSDNAIFSSLHVGRGKLYSSHYYYQEPQ